MAAKVVVSSDSYEIEAEAPHESRPPSMYHSYTGSVRSQDIFVEQIEAQRKDGQRYKIFFPGSDDFELERFGIHNYDQICVPCLILQPRSSGDVSSCVRGYSAGVRRCLSENRRTGSNLGIPRLCVAGGRMSMASMKEGAIILDLSLMRGVKVDRRAETVLVQGGARIQDLDRVAAEFGLMCVTGSYQHLGVVGCLLAGGYGYASRKYGLSCDNVLAAQVVLGDGTVRRCSPRNRKDLLWALCGGGGGIGVVTSVTLRGYPIRNAALVTGRLSARGSEGHKSAIKEWAEWINGDTGAPDDVFSQIAIQSKSPSLRFIASSIDSDAIPQSEAYLELYRDMERVNNTRVGILRRHKFDSDRLPVSWERVPGLCDLKTGELKSRMRDGSFTMLSYCELQKKTEDFFKPGNVVVAYKYATDLTENIIDIVVKATNGSKAINSQSKISISSLGGNIIKVPPTKVAFSARDAAFVIHIEGVWHASKNEKRDEREKQKVLEWVNAVVNSLNACDNVRSTTHPESIRDQVSKSGKNGNGFYNVSASNGKRLEAVKKLYDRRNVFSLASRVSWRDTNSKTESKVSPSSHQDLGGVVSSFSSEEDTAPSKTTGRTSPADGEGWDLEEWDGNTELKTEKV